MKIFGTLYWMELKKILTKKAIYITLLVGLVFFGLVELSNAIFEKYEYPDKTVTGLELEALQREAGEQITGEKMDDAFYEKARKEITDYKETHKEEIKIMEEKNGADHTDLWYSADRTGQEWLLNKEYRSYSRDTDRYKLFMEGSSAEIEESKRNNIIKNFEEDKLTDVEKDYWLKEYDSIPKPFVYSYAQGYYTFYTILSVMIWLVFVLIIIGLSGVFADENTFRTDALILSSRNGRGKVCLAKLAAGLTYSVMAMITVFSVCILMPMTIWGAKGLDTPIQNILPGCAYNMTIGQSIELIFGIGILLSVLFGAFTMMLSHIFRNTTPVLSIQLGILLVCIFSIPEKLGLISKIWTLRPTYFLQADTFFKYRLFNISNIRLNCFEMAGIVYPVLGILFFILTMMLYKRSEVTSR